jgi:hypothetical protein
MNNGGGLVARSKGVTYRFDDRLAANWSSEVRPYGREKWR